MKRLLEIFFLETFLIANMSLLFNYTDFIHTYEGTFSLEASVVGELVLASVALIIMKEFEKNSQNEDVSHVKLYTLRIKCRCILILALAIVCVATIIAWDSSVMQGDVQIASYKSDGTPVEFGIITSVILKLLYGINKYVLLAFNGNIFGFFAAKFGIMGVCISLIMYIYLSYILLRHL